MSAWGRRGRWTAEQLQQSGKAHGRVIDTDPRVTRSQDSWKAREAAREADARYPLVGLCRAAGLPEPVPEYEFHPHRKWRFDYCWPAHKVAIEINGGIWRGYGNGSTNPKAGAHSHPSAILRDMEKRNAAQKFGFRVLEYVPERLPDAIVVLRDTGWLS